MLSLTHRRSFNEVHVLTGVSVSCFLLSYLIVFGMEASRIFFKVPGRNAVLIGMLIAGLFAHSVFLVNQFTAVGPSATQPVSNWFQWSVLGAWCLALAYLVLVIRNVGTSLGLFLIPLILGLIGLGQLLRGSDPFKAETTAGVWRVFHGVSLSVGTMCICFGLAFGVMYLLQSYRLKTRKKVIRTLKLPTLEFLQSMNRLSLVMTAVALCIGVVSGVILNINREGQLNWLSTSVLSTCALFGWSVFALVLSLSRKGSLGGRRSAYLVIANFVFLLIVLGAVLLTSHGQVTATASLPTQMSIEPTYYGSSLFTAQCDSSSEVIC